MTILTLQRRLAEVGRIRIGAKVPTSDGKRTRPSAIEAFRLTSRDQRRIQAASELWGGQVEPWESPSGKQWQVFTETTELDVVVPPTQMAFSQSLELWSAGGCQRRCDGVTESITEQPCLCDPDNRECNIHTRLSVMIRDLPGLGVWRIDTGGYYAAVELGGAVEIIGLAAGAGAVLPARLRLEQRSVKRPNEGVKRFVVPVLDVDVTPGQLIGSGAVGAPSGLLTPVPADLQLPVGAPIGEQAQTFPEAKKAPALLPATGVEPRTVSEVAQMDDVAGTARLLLLAVLDDLPPESEKMSVWEAYLREVFRLMHLAGLWGKGALHASLGKQGWEHVSDLKKVELVELTRKAHAASVKAVA